MTFNVPHYDKKLDTKGLMCPEPIMLLHKAMREMASGDVLLMEATDPSSERDVKKFCEFLSHRLVQMDVDDSALFFYIQKN
ncbi:MAG: sulfurtransferase TusA [Cellvibrionales bacterium]|nr:sulfurtransferase TusA [Cellvibrionales bacterium]